MNSRTDLVLTSLSKHYGSAVAVAGVDLTIEAGRYCCLLGPSGCGKTSTLRMIAGHEEPTAGRITLGGRDITHLSPAERGTAMMFQSYALFPHLTVLDNVAFSARMKGVAKPEREARAAELLKLVHMEAFAARLPAALSGGQRQRVALARALVMRPKVLLLDEPLSALDKKLREQMQVELRRLQQAVGITFILVTHDQYEALAMSDRIAVMFSGRIAQVDAPKELYQKPVNRQVADFLGGMNFIRAALVEEKGQEIVVDTEGFGRVTTDRPQGYAAKGGQALLGIRPERLRVLWDDAKAKHEVAGKVVERHYFGEITHLVVEVPGMDAPLSVTETNNFGADDLPIGAPVRLAYDPDALVALGE